MKWIAWLLSFVMSITGIGSSFVESSLDALSALLWGVPFTDSAVKDDFLAELDDNDVAALDQTNGNYKNLLIVYLEEGTSLLQKFRLFHQNGVVLLGWHCPADLYVVGCSCTSLSGLEELGEALMQNPIVAYAGPVSTTKVTDAETPDDPFSPDDSPNEWSEENPDGSNWWLEAVDARDAWNYTKGAGNIKIGILDSGFNTEHEELAGKFTFPSSKYARQNIAGSHGTHVAGILTAAHNNGLGIAGICPDASLVAVDWSPAGLQLWNSNLKILFGFCDLVKAGAKVINCSFGSSGNMVGTGGNAFGMLLDAAVYSAAFSSLLNKGYDFVVVQSAGNGNQLSKSVDAFYNGTFCPITAANAVTLGDTEAADIVNRIIIVGAVENVGNGQYTQTFYSNVGKQVSLAAPGSDIYSCDVGNTEYCYKSGTSMSAPIVTGIAALTWSAAPDLTGDAVKRIVCDAANTDAVADVWQENTERGLNTAALPMVNAALSVKAALWQTGQYGKAEGTVTLQPGVAASGTVTLQNGDTVQKVELSENGTFSALVKAGEWTVNVAGGNGTVLCQTAVTVAPMQTSRVSLVQNTDAA